MKILYSCALLTALMTLSSGCSRNAGKSFELSRYYRLWPKPVPVLNYQVPGHGIVRIIYANETSYKAEIIKDKNGNDRIIMQEGTIIVNESYDSIRDINDKIPDIAIMVKDSSDNKSQNGWVYYLKKGRETKRIYGRMCIGCHEAANEKHPYFDRNEKEIFRDYVFVPVGR